MDKGSGCDPERYRIIPDWSTQTKETMKLYIAVLDDFPDYMTPTLVAHSVLGYHLTVPNTLGTKLFIDYRAYLDKSFKKVVVRVNQSEFNKIASLPDVYLGHENSTLEGKKSCAVWLYNGEDKMPRVLQFAQLWKPKEVKEANGSTSVLLIENS